jgi:hypothetical protein
LTAASGCQDRAGSDWLETYYDLAKQPSDPDEPIAAAQRRAREAVLEMGTRAVPTLMEAIERGAVSGAKERFWSSEQDSRNLDLAGCAEELLHELFEAGKVPDEVFVKALRVESSTEEGIGLRVMVLNALDARGLRWVKRSRPRALSPELVAVLGELLVNPLTDALERPGAADALGRPGLKSAVPVLLQALKGDPFVARAAATALGGIGPEAREAVPALLEALRGSDPSLTATAAKALGAIGPDAREAVPILKSLAENPPHKEVGGNARRALRALGEVVPVYGSIYERTEVYFAQRSAKEPVKESTEDLLTVEFGGAEGVFFVVDRSGSSMPGVRLAQRYIPRVLESLGDDGEFGIVFFDWQVLIYPDTARPAKAGMKEKADAAKWLLAIEDGNSSCPEKGFAAAMDFCEASSAKRKAIVYIGDGGGTCQGEKQADYLERMCEQVTRRNAGRVPIHAIGVDIGFIHEPILLYLTDQNGGTYTRLVWPWEKER